MSLRTIEVCAGIGGITLGFELAGGFEPVAFIEWDDYANTILAKHWPDVPRYRDLRRTCAGELPRCDVLAGGIPCQPHSLAGKRGASADERDLWPDFFRLVCNLRPRYVVVENVPGLRSSESGRFFGRILRDLAAGGYVVEWVGLSAAEVGAPHKRDRVWIVAHAEGERCGPGREGRPDRSRPGQAEQSFQVLANADNQRQPQPQGNEREKRGWAGDSGQTLADAHVGGLGAGERDLWAGQPDLTARGPIVPDADIARLAEWQGQRGDARPQQPAAQRDDRTIGRWPAQSGLGRAFDGLSPWMDGWEDGTPRTARGVADRVARLRCLGNAVVPLDAAVIGRYIQEHNRRYL